jgi:hypothetical protein
MAYKKIGGHFESAARIAADDIFLIAGDWSRIETQIDEHIITHYSKTIRNDEYVVQSIYSKSTGEESPFVQFVKGGPNAEPIHKYDAIRDLLFNGDNLKAQQWIANNASKKQPWLVDLGWAIQALEGTTTPAFDEENFVIELAANQKLQMQAIDMARQAMAEEAYLLEGETPEPLAAEDWMKQPDEDAIYRIKDLWVKGGNTFVVAPNKAGKTTLVLNVLKSLADGVKFLGRFETLAVRRKVGILNFELDERQYKRWVRKLGIANLECVRVWNLKGQPNSLRTATSRKHFIEQLKNNDIEVLIIDPFSSAFTGQSSNDNDEVKKFLLMLDEIMKSANVEEYLLVVHASHDGSRARGASALADHPDASWFIGKIDTGGVRQRSFRAEGRDVFFEEEELVMDSDGITLNVTGLSKTASTLEIFKVHVLEFIKANPHCTASAIEAGVKGNKARVAAARAALVAEGIVIEIILGSAKKFRVV